VVSRSAYTWDVTTYSAVRTTGIYCRPGCGAKPLAENVRTFELAASAEAAGFRACLRCRPYRVAGPVTSGAPELVCRAVRLIIDGELDTGTETSLGARLAVSPRHLRRMFTSHLGVTPDQLARSRRAHFARRLLDDTDLTVADVAFGSGFASIRQFNRQMREVFLASPSELRDRRRRTGCTAGRSASTAPPACWRFTRRGRSPAAAGPPAVLGRPDSRGRTSRPDGGGRPRRRRRDAGRVGAVRGRRAGSRARRRASGRRAGMRGPGRGEEAARRAGRAVRAACAWPHPWADAPVPSAEALAAGDLADLDLPPATVKSVAALAAGAASGQIVLDHGVSRAELVGSLTAVAGIEPATAGRIAHRLGHREPVRA
jgi:AraC family transcriptional regulator, regulatory protein of adaptative response / DNA-3-methyladenine glycosylase II